MIRIRCFSHKILAKREIKLKIDIATYYYNSTNYGGNLQAYAQCRRLNKDFDTELICIDTARRANGIKMQLKGEVLKLAFKVAKRALKIAHKKTPQKYALAKSQLVVRTEAILRFGSEMIPHSEETCI